MYVPQNFFSCKTKVFSSAIYVFQPRMSSKFSTSPPKTLFAADLQTFFLYEREVCRDLNIQTPLPAPRFISPIFTSDGPIPLILSDCTRASAPSQCLTTPLFSNISYSSQRIYSLSSSQSSASSFQKLPPTLLVLPMPPLKGAYVSVFTFTPTPNPFVTRSIPSKIAPSLPNPSSLKYALLLPGAGDLVRAHDECIDLNIRLVAWKPMHIAKINKTKIVEPFWRYWYNNLSDGSLKNQFTRCNVQGDHIISNFHYDTTPTVSENPFLPEHKKAAARHLFYAHVALTGDTLKE